VEHLVDDGLHALLDGQSIDLRELLQASRTFVRVSSSSMAAMLARIIRP
jgi:hypothetical protein